MGGCVSPDYGWVVSVDHLVKQDNSTTPLTVWYTRFVNTESSKPVRSDALDDLIFAGQKLVRSNNCESYMAMASQRRLKRWVYAITSCAPRIPLGLLARTRNIGRDSIHEHTNAASPAR